MAATHPDTDLLTIAEAARILKVSTVTLQRWIKQGRMRAFRLGPRYIRIRRADLASALVPAFQEEPPATKEMDLVRPAIEIRPPTEAEIQARLEAIAAARALREEMLARRGGKPLPPSWPLIRQEREERSRQL